MLKTPQPLVNSYGYSSLGLQLGLLRIRSTVRAIRALKQFGQLTLRFTSQTIQALVRVRSIQAPVNGLELLRNPANS
jgi:hypothetical protein